MTTVCETPEPTTESIMAPDVGAIVHYGKDGMGNGPGVYRVNSWLRRVLVDPPFTDELDDVFAEMLFQSCRLFDGYRLQFCHRDEATHVSMSGVCGAIAPIEKCVVVGTVEWSKAMIDEARAKAVKMGDKREYVR